MIMQAFDFGHYTLLMSHDPCDLFRYYNVSEMHGLSLEECEKHPNTADDSYIAGLSNFVPKASGHYNDSDDRFVYINLTRCADQVQTITLIMHELMHHSFWLHNYDLSKEEEIISWAENETHIVHNIIQQLNPKTNFP